MAKYTMKKIKNICRSISSEIKDLTEVLTGAAVGIIGTLVAGIMIIFSSIMIFVMIAGIFLAMASPIILIVWLLAR